MNRGKRKAPAGARADATTKTNQPPTRLVQSKLSGKVRPGVRERDRTHYECPGCRWSA